jgi:hypothetical protein
MRDITIQVFMAIAGAFIIVMFIESLVIDLLK